VADSSRRERESRAISLRYFCIDSPGSSEGVTTKLGLRPEEWDVSEKSNVCLLRGADPGDREEEFLRTDPPASTRGLGRRLGWK
jgi:hypothetical protein